jgi:predicted permease
MADDGRLEGTTGGAARPGPVSPTGGPATPPRVLPWLLLYTAGRLVVAVVLIALVWVAGLPGFPALLFGLLLSMPVAYLTLRPVRDRLTEGLVARRDARLAAKEALRNRLSGAGSEQPS